jgi:hypothetical protein
VDRCDRSRRLPLRIHHHGHRVALGGSRYRSWSGPIARVEHNPCSDPARSRWLMRFMDLPEKGAVNNLEPAKPHIADNADDLRFH